MRFSLKSITDKAVAIFLFILFGELAVAMGLGISSMYDYHFYASDYRTYALEEAFEEKSGADLDNLLDYGALTYKQATGELTPIEEKQLSNYRLKYASSSSNVRFVVRVEGTDIELTNTDAQFSEKDCSFSRYIEDVRFDEENNPVKTNVQMYILRNMTAGDTYKFVTRLIQFAILMRYPIIVLFCIFAIAALLVMGALMSSVEVRNEDGSQKRAYIIDRMPLDVLILLNVFLDAFFALLIALTQVADIKSTNIVLWNFVILMISFFLAILALVFNLSIATRIKQGHVYRNTMIYRGAVWIRKVLGKKNEGHFKVPFIGKAMITVGVAVLAELVVLICFLYAYFTNETGLLSDFKFSYYAAIWAAGRFFLIPVFFMMAINLGKIRESGERIAKGDYDFDLESKIMFGDFRQVTTSLKTIQEEMMLAAQEKSRSYELRSELITNISHDIKTPLTSIVNYVDLIQHSNPDSQDMEEYLEILKNQSAKVKMLLESLIEVSKLTTGDVAVNMDTLDISMFIEQTIMEFEDALNEKELELISTTSDDEIPICADGEKLWRVFENLIGNILKYAQPGTRVYLDVSKQEDKVHISFKNISKEQIQTTGDELLRRFKRGDGSRHTEGYGLGLSIAKSLTEIQNGTFDVKVDGDLFCVEMTFALVKA